uniref:Uncharacterized protein n=1 Tax=Myotis myotis TaxID=51298 RepID=A0A7J7RSM2_MYOMY|nr:hypothetical protein mMyoMyo1_010183 [Myotis myotis]
MARSLWHAAWQLLTKLSLSFPKQTQHNKTKTKTGHVSLNRKFHSSAFYARYVGTCPHGDWGRDWESQLLVHRLDFRAAQQASASGRNERLWSLETLRASGRSSGSRRSPSCRQHRRPLSGETLTGVASSPETAALYRKEQTSPGCCCPVGRAPAGLIPVKGTSGRGACRRQPIDGSLSHRCFSPSLPLSNSP